MTPDLEASLKSLGRVADFHTRTGVDPSPDRDRAIRIPLQVR
jgi:hypothetical protein